MMIVVLVMILLWSDNVVGIAKWWDELYTEKDLQGSGRGLIEEVSQVQDGAADRRGLDGIQVFRTAQFSCPVQYRESHQTVRESSMRLASRSWPRMFYADSYNDKIKFVAVLN
jgi:hypothetical protein